MLSGATSPLSKSASLGSLVESRAGEPESEGKGGEKEIAFLLRFACHASRWEMGSPEELPTLVKRRAVVEAAETRGEAAASRRRMRG